MINKLEQKQEMVQSVISYGAGGGMVSFASLADVASVAQSMGLILGCLVILIRLIHDAISLKRFVKKEED